MSEATEASKKAKAEIFNVQMEDGRTVGFAGTRKMVKDYVIAGDTVEAVVDFRNGKTVRLTVDPSIKSTVDGEEVSLLLHAAGHGLVQKLGDEAASEKDVDDAYMAIEELASRLGKGEWSVARESGGFAGASIVVRAIMEVTGQTQEKVKEFLQKKLDASKVQAESAGTKPMTRAQLYDSFRGANTKTGPVIDRMEKEKQAKAAVISAEDANAELEAMKVG